MSGHDWNLCPECREEEYETWAHERIHESIERNSLWLKSFKINDWPRWNYSLDDCTLTFSKDGVAEVVCDIQAVGSVQSDSWEWSWGNRNLPDACKTQLHGVREFGETKGWSKLTSLFLENSEHLGWELASVTSHLLHAQAVYRCPDSETPGYFMYLVILASRFVN